MALVNINNFLRWDNTSGEGPTDTSSMVDDGYIQDAARCDYMPIFKHEESNRWYINSLQGTYWIQEECTLQLINAVTGAVAVANVGGLQKDEFVNTAGDASFNFYAEVAILNSVPEGQYYFQIVGNDSSQVKLTSNNFQIVKVTNTERLRGTVLTNFRHDRYYYGFRYNNLPDFSQQFRLHINRVDQQFETNVEVYKEITTGERRQFNGEADQLYTFETYYFDVYAHSAAAVMFTHEFLYFNERRYIPREAYKTNPDVRTKHSKGTCTCYDQAFSSINHCNP